MNLTHILIAAVCGGFAAVVATLCVRNRDDNRGMHVTIMGKA